MSTSKPNGDRQVVDLTSEQLDHAFRAAVKQAAEQLEIAAATFTELAGTAGSTATAGSNAQLCVELLMEDFRLLDALGWPEKSPELLDAVSS